jgi:hypothetical protein
MSTLPDGPQPCEACERAAAQIIEPCDNSEEPYRLCASCHHRLLVRSLRPLEWYNLAKSHGWHQHLLHDDFYLEDGTADQPNEDVECPEMFPSPTIDAVRRDPDLLLDFTITRWRLLPDVEAVWRSLPRSSVLSALSARFGRNQNPSVRSRILEVAAAALGESGADLVRVAWSEYPSAVTLGALAKASAACLPIGEGLDRVEAALAQLKSQEKRDRMYALGYFRSPRVLDWIERNIFEPTTESWGYLAAASEIDWPRVERWLGQGRPLSLVAIDALLAIAEPRSPMLKGFAPILHARPERSVFQVALTNYRERDSVPRVQHRVGAVLSRAQALTTGG